MKPNLVTLAAALLAASGGGQRSVAQGTAFIYQGHLADGANPANGSYEFRFALYDSASGGNPVGGAVTNTDVAVDAGLFAVALNFGAGVFSGADRWLQIGVRTNGGGTAFTTLNPRQSLLPSPYAVYSASAGAAATAATANAVSPGAVTGSGIQDSTIAAAKIGAGQVVKSLNGLSDAVTLTAGANVTIVPGGGSVVISSGTGNGWSLSGNAGTAAANFLGTTDDQPLEFKVAGQRTLRLEPNPYGPWAPGGAFWAFSSDRNLKDRVQPVDVIEVLDKVSNLPIAEWSYKGYGQRHIGPTAQDFHLLFPLNDDDKRLNGADLHGVTLAAIQGLNQKLAEQDARIRELKAGLSRLEAVIKKNARTKD